MFFMNTVFSLVIVITSLTTGQTFKEQSKVQYPTEHQCNAAGRYIADTVIRFGSSNGFDFVVSWECDVD